MNIELGIQSLQTLTKVFDKHKVIFWLNDGTLLGAIRDKHLIPWDVDIDLCMWKIEKKELMSLCEALKVEGFEVKLNPHGIDVIKEDLAIDLNFRTRGQDYNDEFIFPSGAIGNTLNYLLWVLSLENPEIKKDRMPLFVTKTLVNICTKIPHWIRYQLLRIVQILYKSHTVSYKIHIPGYFYNKLKFISFHGIKVRVPVDSEGFLEYKYGPKWRIPVKGKGHSGGFLKGASVVNQHQSL